MLSFVINCTNIKSGLPLLSVKEISCSISSPAIDIILFFFFYFKHSNWCVVTSHSFICNSLMINTIENFFICLSAIHIFYLVNYLCLLSIFLSSCLFHLAFIITLSVFSLHWHLFLNFMVCCHGEVFHFYAVKFINLFFSLSLSLNLYPSVHRQRKNAHHSTSVTTGYFWDGAGWDGL